MWLIRTIRNSSFFNLEKTKTLWYTEKYSAWKILTINLPSNFKDQYIIKIFQEVIEPQKAISPVLTGSKIKQHSSTFPIQIASLPKVMNAGTAFLDITSNDLKPKEVGSLSSTPEIDPKGQDDLLDQIFSNTDEEDLEIWQAEVLGTKQALPPSYNDETPAAKRSNCRE